MSTAPNHLTPVISRMVDALGRAYDGLHDERYQEQQLLRASDAFRELCQEIRDAGSLYRKDYAVPELDDQEHGK